MQQSIVLSSFSLAPAFDARQQGHEQATISPNLGLTTVDVTLDGDGLHFPGDTALSWQDAETIRADEVGCYTLDEGEIRKIQAFSDVTNLHVSLMPTQGAPTMLIAGFPMHRIKHTDPMRDTQAKIKTIAPMTGRVLDTNMGLGYTAIAAARTAQEVVTIELDPAVVEVAGQNPWSHELFSNPRITRIVGDSFDEVEGMEPGSFARIVHDPPTIQLAGDLYSAEFYRELYRVLERGGRLFHYIGDPDSSHGAKYTPGVIRRLEAAGFTRVTRRPEAFGVSAIKG
ncbi:MAG: spermine synthase [Anaerolineae bacterium]|nr:spermine synthase [Anaerolineae bacterium]